MLNLDELKESVKNKISLHKDICKIAAKNGQLDCLIFLHEENFFWDERAFTLAARNGHLKCLEYLYEKKCPWHAETCEAAAENGHLECLKFLRKKNCPWNTKACSAAASNGQLDCLIFLHEEKCRWDEWTSLLAAKNGHLECLKYAHKKGCLLHKDICRITAEDGHLDCLQYAYKNKFIWDELNMCNYAIKNGNLKIFQYVREKGCPWNKKICSSAAADGYFQCFRYAVENGCPWNKKKCLNLAIKNKKTLVITYIENLLKKKDQVSNNSEISLNCIICQINKKCVLYQPCGHVLSCWSCTSEIKNCPKCYKEISSLLQIFFP